MIAKIKNSIKKRFFRKTSGWTIEEFYTYKFKMLLNLDSYLDYRLYLDNEYETETLRCISELISRSNSKNVWFIDIGSNIGLMSLYIKNKFRHVSVDAFEPIHVNYCQNLINQKINRFQYNLHQLLVGSSNQEAVEIYLNDDVNPNEWNKMNYGMSSIVKNKYHSGKNFETCRMVTFQQFVKEHNLLEQFKNHFVIIKIDVEGAELDVINGMADLLKSKREISILAELLFSESSEKCLEVINTLGSLGFSFFNLSGEKLSPENIEKLRDNQYLFKKD
ncbi:MAG: FkbM family methyltransferase [Flammeovirgaceae bacterium]|nr:FkbM family methyltransferase [Flammeovirgaceae bacterium]